MQNGKIDLVQGKSGCVSLENLGGGGHGLPTPFPPPMCQVAFSMLKQKLTQAPSLLYPRFDSAVPPFILQPDASAVGIGCVLEQDGHVVVYASRVLTNEQHYSIIQREFLAAVYGMQ